MIWTTTKDLDAVIVMDTATTDRQVLQATKTSLIHHMIIETAVHLQVGEASTALPPLPVNQLFVPLEMTDLLTSRENIVGLLSYTIAICPVMTVTSRPETLRLDEIFLTEQEDMATSAKIGASTTVEMQERRPSTIGMLNTKPMIVDPNVAVEKRGRNLTTEMTTGRAIVRIRKSGSRRRMFLPRASVSLPQL
jgi:hypothetical protein